MNKIVIASDSFKGSLSSAEVAEAVAAGILKVHPGCTIIKLAIGDGGEGTCEAIAGTLPCEWIKMQANDPLGRKTDVKYAICRESSHLAAIIEMAQASGLTLLRSDELDPTKASTYGTGEMIRDAASRGCRRFIIGLGGSATNDGGTGMLEALGFRFFDKHGNTIVGCCGGKLSEIAGVDDSEVPEEIVESSFTVACDVETPFCGKEGATEVFARQKGATEDTIQTLEAGMQSFAEIIKERRGINLAEVKGSGAAGGTGGALYAFLGAELCKGADIVLDAAGFDEAIADADLVITGEGRIDRQTFAGKLPSSVLKRAAGKGVPAIAIAGLVEIDQDEAAESGFQAIVPIQPRPASAEELHSAMSSSTTSANISRTISSLLSNCSLKHVSSNYS